MITTNEYETALRAKIRFQSSQGLLSMEDLWDLPLTSGVNRANLDDVAKAAHKRVKESEETSFVGTASSASKIDQLRLEIVKHVITVRQKENEDKIDAINRRAKLTKIEDAIARRRDADLESMTVDELEKLKTSMV